MLAQLDHIALTAENFSRQDEFLRLAGYERVFFYEDIPNPDNKRGMMEKWTDRHDLALYEKDGCVPIELIEYGHAAETPSRYSIQHDVFDESQNCTRLEAVGEISSSDAEYDTVLLRTADTEASQDFWDELGWTPERKKRLHFESLTGGVTTKLELLEDETASAVPPIDGRGFPCLAFVTTSINSDRDRLEEAGYTATDVSRIEFPDGSMRIAFVFGPGGEPVELIDPQ